MPRQVSRVCRSAHEMGSRLVLCLLRFPRDRFLGRVRSSCSERGVAASLRLALTETTDALAQSLSHRASFYATLPCKIMGCPGRASHEEFGEVSCV
ncbi:hypothetical protein HRbin28_01477 [bacterium HR28]|mgnify:CR=1 FL=1|jgi:hypothetical protein|nr:hypothetical protein HRbin28_01477 [bacterium HR28]